MRHVLLALGVVLFAGPALARPVPMPVGKPAVLADRTPSGIIEAKAAQEAERQAVRDARFDAQVKRITGTICQGCTAGVPAHFRAR